MAQSSSQGVAIQTQQKDDSSFDLGMYTRGNPLGRGAFGFVFKYERTDGLDGDPPQYIAVKEVMIPDDSESKKKSFKREHMIMMKHKHKNIVSYLGMAKESKMSYFVMELCTANLKQFCKSRILFKPEISVIIKELLIALAYLHGKNIIHRDVKPANILIKTSQTDFKNVHVLDLEVKLCDFGLSRQMCSLSKTMSLTTVGTQEYMPPEARGDLAAKNPTTHCTSTFDTFSAGVVTHELLTGVLHPDVDTYTNFRKMKLSLGQNYDGEGDLIYSFLKDMLNSNKRKRKTPNELLSHQFIEMGEKYLEQERFRLASLKGSEPEDQVRKVNKTENVLDDHMSATQRLQGEQMITDGKYILQRESAAAKRDVTNQPIQRSLSSQQPPEKALPYGLKPPTARASMSFDSAYFSKSEPTTGARSKTSTRSVHLSQQHHRGQAKRFLSLKAPLKLKPEVIKFQEQQQNSAAVAQSTPTDNSSISDLYAKVLSFEEQLPNPSELPQYNSSEDSSISDLYARVLSLEEQLPKPPEGAPPIPPYGDISDQPVQGTSLDTTTRTTVGLPWNQPIKPKTAPNYSPSSQTPTLKRMGKSPNVRAASMKEARQRFEN